MRLTNLALLSTGLCLALFACRGGSDGDDTPNPDGPPGGSVKVKDVQNDAMPKGTAIELRGVVVTALDNFGDRTGDMYVQDVEGGEFSGIKVFGVALNEFAALQVGDIVDITNAEKDEFKFGMDEGSVTEVKGAAGGMLTVTKKGTGTVPAPANVDAKAINALPTKEARMAEWEKWEGVLIKVSGARQLAAVSTFGSMPGPDSTEFRITGVARVQSALVELPATATLGVCYESITGIGDHFFNDLIHPRSAADLVVGGTACNPMATTVVQTQTQTNPELANLTDVIVTAIDDIGTTTKGFWVSDAAQSALNAGVYVFTRDAIPANVAVGKTVSVVGGVDEFDLGSGGNPPMGDTITEIVSPVVTVSAAAAVIPLPLAATAAQVADITNGEPYEGVLVRVSNLKVTNINAGAGKVELTDNAGGKVIMDDDVFDWPDQVLNDCYTTVTGVMNLQIFDNIRTLNPRSAADFVVGATCN